MGLFSALFKNDKSYEELINECKGKILSAYGISSPNQVQEFRTILAIAIAFTGILNDIGKGRASHVIDELTDTARSMTTNLRFTIEDVAADEKELQLIIDEMPPVANATRNLKTNGLPIFEILFNNLGPELVKDIMTKTGGPLGSPGYATIVVGDLVVGREKSKVGFMSVSKHLLETVKEVAGKI
jgi:hypothetical protein